MSAPDTSPQFFGNMFRHSADPWNFATDTYEQFRYGKVLQALGDGPYRHAFEPGCSVGVFTEKLARICDTVDACDFAPEAVEAARRRCAHLPCVTVRCASLAQDAAYGRYDLIVLSEIGYYFTAEVWRAIAADIVLGMQPGATLLLSHWLGSSPDHRLRGDEVHDLVPRVALRLELSQRFPDAERGGFLLNRWKRLP